MTSKPAEAGSGVTTYASSQNPDTLEARSCCS